MTDQRTRHRIGTREEWVAAREKLLLAEKELTRRSDEVARQRLELPWVLIDKDYRFETEEGPASLADLFDGRSQLLIQHIMSPNCPACASTAQGWDGLIEGFARNDVTIIGMSRYPIADLTAARRRRNWHLRYVSSFGSTFNYDFGLAYTDEEVAAGNTKHNLHTNWDHDIAPEELARFDGVPAADQPRDAQGMSAFALEDGRVYHTYSAYARGTDVLSGLLQWLDRAPKGRP